MKMFLKILVWVLTAGAIVTGWVFTHKEHIEHPLKCIQLSIHRNVDDGFIDRSAVYHAVADICDTVNNRDVMMIPVDSVRKYLKTIPWTISSDANISLDEILVVDITECSPIMRVYNKKGKSVYLDNEGRVFPTCSRYVPHLLIGSGEIDFYALSDRKSDIHFEEYSKTELPVMFDVMKKVIENPYTNCCVKQVYYAKNKRFELTMNNVDMDVVLGDANDVDEKLMNLQYFFEQMQGNPEMKNYCSVNFNFENQVVCTKNKTK